MSKLSRCDIKIKMLILRCRAFLPETISPVCFQIANQNDDDDFNYALEKRVVK